MTQIRTQLVPVRGTSPQARTASHLCYLDLSLDGNQWSVLFGSNIQEGIAGFGDTPDAAVVAFDAAFRTLFVHPPIPIRDHDWVAWVDGREGWLTGNGETELDALRDLLTQIEEAQTV